MHLPGLMGLLYLFVLLIVVPHGAIRSWKVLGTGRPPDPARAVISRRTILRQSIVNLGILGVLTWLTAATLDFAPLARPPRFGVREILIGIAAFGLTLAASWLARIARPESERDKLAIYQWMPQDGPERALFVVSALLAGLVEEAAYRGVLVTILAGSLGSVPAAALISALAFAVGHAVQGWQSGIVVFAVALVMQGTVWLTDTLLVAMVVHAVFDVIAGIRAGNTARKLAAGSPDPETPSP